MHQLLCANVRTAATVRTLYELNQTSWVQKEFGTGRRFTLYCPSPVQGSGLRFRSAKFGHRTDVNTCDITSNNRTFAPCSFLAPYRYRKRQSHKFSHKKNGILGNLDESRTLYVSRRGSSSWSSKFLQTPSKLKHFSYVW